MRVRSERSAFVIPAISTSASSARTAPGPRARSRSAGAGPLVFSLTTRSGRIAWLGHLQGLGPVVAVSTSMSRSVELIELVVLLLGPLDHRTSSDRKVVLVLQSESGASRCRAGAG